VITPQQSRDLIEAHREDPEFVLLDIRTDPEIEAAHIHGTTSLDFYSPAFRDDLARLDRSKTYLIYCRTGNRTGQAYTMMEDLGFDKVFDMGGGITAWQALGYPVCAGSLESPHVCTGWLGGSSEGSS
jgi:rhodanese-related sulfurtransferase